MSYFIVCKFSYFKSNRKAYYTIFSKYTRNFEKIFVCWSKNINFATQKRRKQWDYTGAGVLKFFQVFVSIGAKVDQAYQWGQEAQK